MKRGKRAKGKTKRKAGRQEKKEKLASSITQASLDVKIQCSD